MHGRVDSGGVGVPAGEAVALAVRDLDSDLHSPIMY